MKAAPAWLRALTCAAAGVIAACGDRRAPTQTPRPAQAERTPLSNTAPSSPPAVAAPRPPPTLAAAGGAACTLLPPVLLGSIVEGHAEVEFGGTGGLAAWKRDPSTLALQPLAPDGAARGRAVSVSNTGDLEPRHIFAIDRGFLVLLVHWDWRRGDARWWGIFVERDGSAPHPPMALGMADMDVKVGQRLGGDRVGLVLLAAAIAKQPPPARWQTLEVARDGRVSSTPIAVRLDDVLALPDAWVPATLGGRRGWTIGSDGVFEGVRAASAGALPLDPDAVRAEVQNLARPNPPGPGGQIIESMASPALARSHAGRSLGAPTPLEVRGNPVGVTGFLMSGSLAWSGTHFVYSYSDRKVAALLPIDCHP